MAKLSVIIPVFNEKSTIHKILERVENAKLPDGVEKEIILIDDFSTDGTRDILKGLKSKYEIYFHEKNLGKGAGVRTGLLKASGDYVIIQDADLEYDPKEYINLLMPIIEGQADVVYGSRFLGGRPHRVLYFWHYMGNQFLTLLSNMFTNLNLSDMETCYKAFNKQVIEHLRNSLNSNRFGIEPEITAKIKQFRIFEVGISYYGRTYKDGKKIGWKDGVAAIYFIVKYNLFG